MIYWALRLVIGQRGLAWLAQLVDETNNTAALKQAAYMVVVAAGVVWLSIDMAIKESGAHRGIDANWCTAFGILVGLATAAKVWWRKKEGT